MSAVYFSLASGNFSQDWSNTSQINANDDWSGVPSIVGYRGDDLIAAGDDPRLLTGSSDVIDVNHNVTTSPDSYSTGGVVEFGALADPTIAIQGSGTADSPYIVLHLDATGRQNVTFSTRLRDIDAGTTSAQPIAIQYRVGTSGNWLNVEGGYVANANIGSDTNLSVTLPAAANGEAEIQIRVITTDVGGSDALIGIDDIVVTSEPLVEGNPGVLSIGDASVTEGDSGSSAITFTVERQGGSTGAISADYAVTFAGGAGSADASDLASALTGSVSFADGETSKTITLQVAGDLLNEGDEKFTVALSAPTGGAMLGDAQGTGTIVNDDAALAPGAAFINEIHYDNGGGDVGEAIEIAAAAGTDLSGWKLVLYSVSSGATEGTVYSTKALGGIVPDQDDGYGTLSFAVAGLQNGEKDGIALVNADGQVVQFLSYEGSFVAKDGPAAGLTSTDIGVFEGGSTPVDFSLQLTGSGAVAGDFKWVDARADSFGAVNADQDFIGADATGLVTVGDARVVEGDDGVTQLVFTVRRAGGLGGGAGVEWFINTNGSADLDDLAPGQPLSGLVTFAPGVSEVTVSIGISGDTAVEPNETFNLLLANPVGNISITDDTAVGTIANDDPIPLRIFEIQGEGHRSAYEGQPVLTQGIVTAVASNGFYLQDPEGDGKFATSDALFVFTGSAPAVAIGDAVNVSGTVGEFLPGGDPVSLTVTQISGATVTVQSSGNALPAATVIGTEGVQPPTETIDDDALAVFDPENDGIDFYEAMEGMRITIDAPLVVANSTQYGETYVVASGGAGATGVNERGGITIAEGDFNPEKIQIDANPMFPGYTGGHTQGDLLGDVTGVLSYGFNSYELLVTEAVTVETDAPLPPRDETTLEGDRNHLTVASYNVENLDAAEASADGSPDRFDILASDIVYNLAAPDIIALQEIQDADGTGRGSDLSGVATAQELIDAIAAIGGPNYVYVEIAPTTAGSTGGQGGGNIRNGYLYNADRVDYVEGSAELITGSAFTGSRNPLVADFTFNGETVTLINVHFTARSGSDPLFGADQPPSNEGDAARAAQGAAVAAHIENELATDPSLNLGVLGDFNGFYFEDGVEQIEMGGVLTNLHDLLPVEDRYSYLFEGNLQPLDNFLVTGGLAMGAQFDAVHINAEQLDNDDRATDHDPLVARFFIEAPNEAPEDLLLSGDTVAENMAAGTLVGTLSASDIDEDLLAYTLLDDAGGLFTVDAETGELRTTAALNFEGKAEYQIVARATDPDGLSAEQTFTVKVTDVNEAPVAAADTASVNEDASTGNLWSQLLGNDSDPDAGQVPTIAGVDTSGTLGSVVFDPQTQTLRYVADHDSFDSLAPGEIVVDRFTYTITDAAGLTSTATVEVTVTGIDDGIRIEGANRSELLVGTAGEDEIAGRNGDDELRGLDGHDYLIGDNGGDLLLGGIGNDLLAGGRGSDLLEGGEGADIFLFGKSGGRDVIADFDVEEDSLFLMDGMDFKRSSVGDVDGDGVDDLTIAFDKGASAVLLGVSDFSAVRFADDDLLAAHPLI